MYQILSIYTSILYYFKSFYGIELEYSILRVAWPFSIIVTTTSNVEGH